MCSTGDSLSLRGRRIRIIDRADCAGITLQLSCLKGDKQAIRRLGPERSLERHQQNATGAIELTHPGRSYREIGFGEHAH